MRIMQLGATKGGGGIAVAVRDLTSALAESGHDVCLVCSGGEGLDELRRRGVEVVVTNWDRRLKAFAASAACVRNSLRKSRPDIVHVHSRIPSLACILSGRIPDFYTMHSIGFSHQVGVFDRGWIRRVLSPTAKTLVALNDEAKRWIVDNLSKRERDVVVVPNGVDCRKFIIPTREARSMARARFNLHDRDTCVLYMGRLHPRKQPDGIVRLAAAAAGRGMTDVKFVIAGAGPLEATLRREIAARGLAGQCIMRPWMEPLEAYWAADLVVLPSMVEGFPLGPCEALATGCPVFRTRTGGFNEMIVDGITGFGCEISIDDFVRVGLTVLERRASFGAMREACRTHAVEHLDLESQCRRMVEQYTRALSATHL